MAHGAMEEEVHYDPEKVLIVQKIKPKSNKRDQEGRAKELY